MKGGDVKEQEERGDGRSLGGANGNQGGVVREPWETSVQILSDRKEDTQLTI